MDGRDASLLHTTSRLGHTAGRTTVPRNSRHGPFCGAVNKLLFPQSSWSIGKVFFFSDGDVRSEDAEISKGQEKFNHMMEYTGYAKDV